MYRPQMTALDRTQQIVDTFGGYCRKTSIESNQFADMQNMTADAYPALAPRKRRGVVEEGCTLPGVLHGRETLWHLDTDDEGHLRLHRGGEEPSVCPLEAESSADKLVCTLTADEQEGDDGPIRRLTFYPIPGDVDGKNGVTEDDVLLTLQAATGKIRLTEHMAGDVNGDGEVTAADALLALQATTGKITLNEVQRQAADADGDGEVTVEDAWRILKAATDKSPLDAVQRAAADVNGDGEVTTEDALRILQLVNDEITTLTPRQGRYYEAVVNWNGVERDNTPLTIHYSNTDYPVLTDPGSGAALEPLTATGMPIRAILRFCNTDSGGAFVLQERRLVSMGAYIVVFPDKVAYNTDSGEWMPLEKRYAIPNKNVTYTPCRLRDDGGVTDIVVERGDTAPVNPQGGMYWYDKNNAVLKQYDANEEEWVSVATAYVRIQAKGIGTGFSVYDGVSLSGAAYPLLDGSTVLWDVGDDYIVVTGMPYEQQVEGGTLTVTRTTPVMDHVTELNNRLWGCRSDRNEIYCSKLGDPTNWNCFMGTAEDSYAATVGTSGAFTGVCAYGGAVLFFKENVIHRVYGTKPANFQITTLNVPGVQEGSHASVAVVNEVLYYKGVNGIYAYTGNLPALISEDLGQEVTTGAVGGRWDERYTVSMRAADGGWHLFVFDPRTGLWHRQDNTHMLSCASVGKELYYVASDPNGVFRLMSMGGSLGYSPRGESVAGAHAEEAVAWFVETGDLEMTTLDNLTVAQIRLRLSVEPQSRVRVALRYDDDPVWNEVWRCAAVNRRVMTIPLIPRRCGRMRLRIEGVGSCRIYALSMMKEQGSELRGGI